MENTALQYNHPIADNSVSIWDDKASLNVIRTLCAPRLNEIEFNLFVRVGKATNLNPLLREIWAIKYQDNEPAKIFVGRDGYRKAAQAHPEYDGHTCDAVYENDSFTVSNGIISHSYQIANRGALIGAYCIVKRRRCSIPSFVFVELKEYSTGKSLWNQQNGKPATMIKKVAESQCLRAAFQDLLGGTYAEEEYNQDKHTITITGENQVDKLKSILGIGEDSNAKERVVSIISGNGIASGNAERDSFSATQADNQHPTEATSDPENYDLRVSDEQLTIIKSLLVEKKFSDQRCLNALEHYGISCLEELSAKQAQEFIYYLEK